MAPPNRRQPQPQRAAPARATPVRVPGRAPPGSRGGAAAPPEPADEDQRTPEEAALGAAAWGRLEGLLRRLPDEQRVAVVLRDVYGYDLAEVAALQRCGLSAAKMRVSRGRAALRRLLREPGPAGGGPPAADSGGEPAGAPGVSRAAGPPFEARATGPRTGAGPDEDEEVRG